MRPARPNRRYQIALLLDRRVGPLLCAALAPLRRLRRGPEAPASSARKILLLKFWGMGSLVLASPLLDEIQRTRPGVRMDVVTLRENAAIAALYPGVSRCHTLDLGRGIVPFLGATLALIRRLRRERYDLLLDLEFYTRFSALFSFLCGARRSHGFSSKGSARGRLHDVEIPFNLYQHVSSNFLTLLRGEPMQPASLLDPEHALILPPLRAGEAARRGCDTVLSAHPAWRHGRSLVVVNPNAGDMALERRWPLERVAALLRALCARDELNVALTGAASEAGYVASVVEAAGVKDRVVDLAGRLGIEELVALFERAAVVVTNDSGPLHIACAAGASTVALFGPETPVLYGPLRSRPGQRHRVHYRRLACSPCMFVHDDKVLSCWFAHARCMSEITDGDVQTSVDELLAEVRTLEAGLGRASA